MPDGPAALEEAYNAVEDIVNEVEQYVKVGVVPRLYTAYLTFFPPLNVFRKKPWCSNKCENSALILIFFHPGVAAVPVLVGHAGREHLQSSGRRPHQVAGPAGPDSQSSWNFRQRRDQERFRTSGHRLWKGINICFYVDFWPQSWVFTDCECFFG